MLRRSKSSFRTASISLRTARSVGFDACDQRRVRGVNEVSSLVKSQNYFSADYYSSVIAAAKKVGYIFLTMAEYYSLDKSARTEKIALLRHDVDSKPNRSKIFMQIERDLGVRSTFFVLLHDINYNALSVRNLRLFSVAEAEGFEIGLHTNFVETSALLGHDPDKLFEAEVNILRSYFNVRGVACHRNIDSMYNSLPYLEAHWSALREKHALTYQAYEPQFVDDLTYISDGPTPHLGWRGKTPEDVISSGASICLSTHPHWWHRDHAFED